MKPKNIFSLIVFWQLLLVAITLFAISAIKLRPNYLVWGQDAYNVNPLLLSRANFDGAHYAMIAKFGYKYSQQAFFPFYPKLISITSQITNDQVLSGVIISLVSFTGAIFVLNKLIRIDFKNKVSYWTIILLISAPTAFYFSSVYTESLFLLLILLSFYFARKRNWLWAGVFGALASYTRFVGVFLFPALLVEFWISEKLSTNFQIKKLLPIVFIFIIPLGLLTYMSYLTKTTGDPWEFIHVQSLFSQGRSEKIILPYQVVWRYIKMILTVNRQDPLYLTIWFEFLTAILFGFLTIVSFFKQRLSYAIFSLSAFLVPTLTGIFTSLPRYVLICFSCFILLGTWAADHPKWGKRLVILNLLILALYYSLFVRGYWVG